MLILMRKVGESIIIGDVIEVKVTKITGSQVTLAIEAPDFVGIVRKELINRGKKQK